MPTASTAFLIKALSFERKTRLMDVGANPTHKPPYFDLLNAGNSELHGFEPQQDAFEKLMASKQDHETYHPYAVGRSRETQFQICAGSSFSSLYRPSDKHIDFLGHWKNALTVAREVDVQTHALDDIPDLPKPDFLKMDVQGAELEILQTGRNTLSDAVAVMPEVRFFQIYEDEPMFGEVDGYLREMGFMLLKILPGATLRITSSRMERLRPAMTRSQMIDSDAIYIRDMVTTEYSDEQLRQLAVLCDSVFDSVDVTLRCLDMLVDRGRLDPAVIDAYIDSLPPNYRKPA